MNPKKINILDFYEFVYDRQKIWYDRFVVGKPAPWTKDKYLSTFKFCNCYRENDRGTQYLIKTIINRKDLSLEDKFLNCVAYRRFNLPGFFDWIDGPMVCNTFFLNTYISCLDQRKEEGHNLFNDAYIVSQTPYNRKFGRKEKHVQQLLILRDVAKEGKVFMAAIRQMPFHEIHQFLKDSIFGMGDFLAYQTVTDLTYFPEFKNKWDVNSFVAMGPGSKPGVDLLFPKRIADYETCCESLWRAQEEYFNRLRKEKGKEWMAVRYSTPYCASAYLSLSNIQSCLCEFRKYVMLQLNPNKRKRYYKGV